MPTSRTMAASPLFLKRPRGRRVAAGASIHSAPAWPRSSSSSLHSGAIAGAVGTVSLRNPFYAVLALVGHLLALAALFLLLRAEFVAAAQVVVYAGAVMVLYVFVVAYVGGPDAPSGSRAGPGAALRPRSLFAGALLVEFFDRDPRLRAAAHRRRRHAASSRASARPRRSASCC